MDDKTPRVSSAECYLRSMSAAVGAGAPYCKAGEHRNPRCPYDRREERHSHQQCSDSGGARQNQGSGFGIGHSRRRYRD